MTNTVFIDYSTTNGEILSWGIWPTFGIENLFPLDEGRARYQFEVDPGEEFDFSNCCVELGATVFSVLPRPEFDAPESVTIPLGGQVLLRDLPDNCVVELDGERYPVESGTLELTAETEAEFSIRLTASPFIPKTVRIEVTP